VYRITKLEKGAKAAEHLMIDIMDELRTNELIN
jgi:hypothetical protein